MDGDGLVFAASEFANSVPLVRFIRDVCPGARVVNGVPASMADRIPSGEADVALVPVADALVRSGLEIIPGIGVCACERVQSVLLKCRQPIERVRTVALDPASRTSNALARIILEQRYGRAAEMRLAAAGEALDAEVMIGDRALLAPPAPCGDRDLAAEWHALTGLPFVFAVWVCRAGHPRMGELSDSLRRVKEAGVRALADLARSESVRLGLPLARCQEYFQRCIYYDVGPREAEAMRRFREMLADGMGG